MPFNNFFPRSFTEAGIRTYAPVASGVYGISNAQGWIYVGEGDDIQTSLLNHLFNAETSVVKAQPTGFVFELSPGSSRMSRYTRLVQEYHPTCNRQGSR